MSANLILHPVLWLRFQMTSEFRQTVRAFQTNERSRPQKQKVKPRFARCTTQCVHTCWRKFNVDLSKRNVD